LKSARKKIKKHYNFHHPYPTSRAKNGDLGVFKPLLHPLTRKAQIPKHDLWHNLFLNLFAEEIISKIKKSFDEGKESPAEIISCLKAPAKKAGPAREKQEDLTVWQEIFGCARDFCEIEKIILKNWAYPGIMARVSDNGKIAEALISLKDIPSDKAGKIIRIMFKRYQSAQITPIILEKNILFKISPKKSPK